MKKKQGYNSRLDESLDGSHKGKKKQSMQKHRYESKGIDKSKRNRAYSGEYGMRKSYKKEK